MRSTLLFTSALFAGANASLTACAPSDYKLMCTAAAKGFQIDITSEDTDCFRAAEGYANKLESFFQSFTTFSIDDWADPIYQASALTVQLTDLFADCQSTNFAKQMSVRFSTLSGLFEMISEFGVAALKEFVTRTDDEVPSELW